MEKAIEVSCRTVFLDAVQMVPSLSCNLLSRQAAEGLASESTLTRKPNDAIPKSRHPHKRYTKELVASPQ